MNEREELLKALRKPAIQAARAQKVEHTSRFKLMAWVAIAAGIYYTLFGGQ